MALLHEEAQTHRASLEQSGVAAGGSQAASGYN
jgi:hypothetical protein